MGLFSFFQKKQQEQDKIIQSSQSSASKNITNARNWYADRYEAIVVQRNLLFVFSALGLAIIFVSVFFIGRITMHKTIEPMVIEVEEMSGITNIVDPLENRRWTESKAVNEYFLMEYLRARETYNVATYLHNYNDIVRLLSTASVYRQFKSVMNNPSTSPVAKYGGSNSTTLKIRSIQFLGENQNGKNAEIRFVVTEEHGSRKSYNKIASVVWDYIEMNLNFEQRMINPLGFEIKSYSVTGERDVS